MSGALRQKLFRHSVGYRGATRLVDGLPESVSVVRMAYLDEFSRCWRLNFDDLDIVARRILSQKKSIWSYEREWRVLAPHLGEIEYRDRGSVKEIYFGSRIDAAHRTRVLKRLGDLADRNI